MTQLYDRMVGEVNVKMHKQSHFTGALMGYSQFSIFGVYGLIIYFGGYEVESGRASFDQMLKVCVGLGVEVGWLAG